MGGKQMKCLNPASPSHSVKDDHITSQSTHTLKDELITSQSTHTPKDEFMISQPTNPTKAECVISQLTHTSKDVPTVPLGEDQVEPVDNQSEETGRKSDIDDLSSLNLCLAPGPSGSFEESSWQDQLDAHQEQLEKEMQEARKMVSRLQALLLHGSLPEEDQCVLLGFGESRANAEQQLILIRSRLDQSTEEALDLKREVLRYKQESRHIQAIKEAQQRRMAVQETAVLQLKQDALRASMAREELEGQNTELQRKLSERNTLLSEYKLQMGHKEKLLHQQQQKLEEALHGVNRSSHRRFSGCENNGYSHPVASPCHSTYQHTTQDEEVRLVREALRNLRDGISGHDPQHHTLDTLEQGLSSMMERLHILETCCRKDRRALVKSSGRRANPTDRDSWPPTSRIAHSHSSPVLDSAVSTKVLYFTERSLTPFLVNIPKRLGEVTLHDFKAAVDRHGSFRYHFKALDPEFGTVKEEVFQDAALVPGWEGKIVAWVEEDHGEGR